MATKVYRDGDNIKLEFANATSATINVADFSFVINSTTGGVTFNDSLTPASYKDKGTNLQNQSGLEIGGLGQIDFYLNLIKGPSSSSGATSKRTFSFSGARSSNGGADRDMMTEGVLTNVTALIIPYNCELQIIAASTQTAETWDAHVYKNGVSVASINIVAVDKFVSAALSVSFVLGDEVRLRQQNGTGAISRPNITSYFKEV